MRAQVLSASSGTRAFVTPERLEQEIVDEVHAAGGRIALHELPVREAHSCSAPLPCVP